MFDLVAFDADDTLWHNEDFYWNARRRFRDMMAKYELNGSADEHADYLEVANIEYYGYGVMSFILSLIEAAIDLTEGAVKTEDIEALMEMGKEMLTAQVQVFEGAEETVARVAETHPLMLITKGDLLHQQNKVSDSGLRSYFQHVQVVSHKTPQTYARILERLDVEPGRFLMVGNSMRSDILPVLEVGGWTVHVPSDRTWGHEVAELPAEAGERFFEVEHLEQVPDLLQELSNSHR